MFLRTFPFYVFWVLLPRKILSSKFMRTYSLIEKDIGSIIPLYIENDLSNDVIEKMNTVRIYGDIVSPRYHLKDVAQLLNMEKPIQATENFDEDERELAYVINSPSSKIKKKYLLTEDGLQRFIYQSNTPIGKLFRKCTKFVFDELLTKQSVKMIDLEKHVESKHIELYKKTVLTLQKNMRKIREKNYSLQSRIEFAAESEEHARRRIKEIQYNADCAIRDKMEAECKLKILSYDYDKMEHELASSPEYLQRQNILELQKKYTKSIYVYLEEIPSGVKTSSLGIDEYDIKDLQCHIQEDVMIYNIFNKKNIKKTRVLAHTIYGSSNGIYESLCRILYDKDGPYVNKLIKDMLLCSIEDIIGEFDDASSHS